MMEIWVDEEEFKAIKRNREKGLTLLNDEEKFKLYLLSLKFKFLREKLNKLEKRLADITESYAKLKNFERRAVKDKEFLMEIRQELSLENSNLRRTLKDEGNVQKEQVYKGNN